jgi:uncharacterized Rmd1/YagE family protein
MTSPNCSPCNQIYALCYCETFQFERLKQHLNDAQACEHDKEVLNVSWSQGDVFLFEYGVVVFWNVDTLERMAFLQTIEQYASNPLTHLIEDEFTYALEAAESVIKNDCISMTQHDRISRLALSHGIAQSTKLAQFEYQVQQTINDTAYIPKNIALTGKSRLSAKELSKLRGRLFITKSNVMLKYDLLDVPEFFWEYPELDYLYALVTDYLEVKQRIGVLSKKLETIHELFEMMSEEQKHKHSSLLEWIIIWLIAFEVFVTIFHDLLSWI